MSTVGVSAVVSLWGLSRSTAHCAVEGAPQAYDVARINDPQSRLPAQASLLWLRHRGVHRTPATQRDSDYLNVYYVITFVL